VSTKHKIMLSLVIMFLLNFMLFIVFGNWGLVDLNHLQDRRDDMGAENHRLSMENLGLGREIHRLKHDPAYIEHVARKELGMIRKGETILRFAPEKLANEGKSERTKKKP
jgi:cell division protein FtsB